MKKGQIYEGIVTDVDFPNKGIVQIEEMLEDGQKKIQKVMVKNAITGQKIRFIIQKARKGKFEGRILECLEKSEMETREDVCKSFGACGGCSYQTLPYQTQLSIKEEQVKKLLRDV